MRSKRCAFIALAIFATGCEQGAKKIGETENATAADGTDIKEDAKREGEALKERVEREGERIGERVKREEPAKIDEPAKIEEPAKSEEQAKIDEEAKAEEIEKEGKGTVEASDVASCKPGADVAESLTRLVKLADTNRDGALSEAEAKAGAGFLVGGFFFNADSNSDGTVTPEEGKAAREQLFAQQPTLASAVDAIRQTTGQGPFAQLADLLGLDKPMTTADARKTTELVVEEIFKVADSDRNDLLTVEEAREATWRGVGALGHTAFQSADQNDDDKLTADEFHAAMKTPEEIAFNAADADDNGELSQQEAAVAMERIVRQLGMPRMDTQAMNEAKDTGGT